MDKKTKKTKTNQSTSVKDFWYSKNHSKVCIDPTKKQFADIKGGRDVYRLSHKATIIVAVSFIVIIAALLTIGAFFDKQIDQALSSWALPKLTDDQKSVDLTDGGSLPNHLGQVYTNSIFGKLVEVLGIAPCIIATIFCMGIFYFNADRIKRVGLRRFTKGSMIFLSLFWFWFGSFFTFFPQMIIAVVGLQNYAPYAPLSNGSIAGLFVFLAIIIGGALTWGIFVCLSRVKKQNMYELFRWAMIVSSAALASILLMEVILKPILQRERFRFIYAIDQLTFVRLADGTTLEDHASIVAYFSDYHQYGGFHPWYDIPISPNAYQSGNFPFLSEDITKSCPSGHETMAAVGSLSLVLLPMTVRNYNTRKTRAWCFSLAAIGTIVVAFGRLVAGAHYLSDVTIGVMIASGFLTIFYLSNSFGSKYLNTATKLCIYPSTLQTKKKQAHAK